MSNTSLQLLCWTVSLFPSVRSFFTFVPSRKRRYSCIADSSAQFLYFYFFSIFFISPLRITQTQLQSGVPCAHFVRTAWTPFLYILLGILDPTLFSYLSLFKKTKKISTSHMICYFNIFIGMPFDVFIKTRRNSTLPCFEFSPLLFPSLSKHHNSGFVNPHLLCFCTSLQRME